MTDQEKLDDLNKQIDSLVNQKLEITDTLAKAALSKDRFRFFDYGDYKYWIKIVFVNESDCDTIEVFEEYSTNSCRIERDTNSFSWLQEGISVVEEIFNATYNEILNKIKL